MIRFKKLSIKNFLSYGEVPTIINLDNVGTTLIVGEDLDNTASGTGANGVGKTVWVNALIYALYGKPISNISLDNLVNNINKKNMEVIVDIEKDGNHYTIKRVRKETGEGSYTRVYIRPIGVKLDEKEHDKTPDSTNNINKFIVEHLGIPFELFVRIVAFSATQAPFLDMPVRHASQANQSDIMEELFRLTRLSEKAELVKAKLKDTKQSLEIKLKHNEQLEKEQERHNKQVESAKARVDDWIDDNEYDIEQNTKKLASYTVVDVEQQEKYHNDLKINMFELQELKTKRDSVDKESILLNSDLKEQSTELSTLKTQRKSIAIRLEEFDEELAIAKKAITADVSDLEKINISKQRGFHKLKNELEDAIFVLVKNIHAVADTCAEQEDIIKTNEDEISHLDDAQCPYCLQDFEGSEAKMKNCKSLIKTAKEIIAEGTDTIKLDDVAVDKSKAELSNAIRHITTEEHELDDIERKLLDNKEKLHELKTAINPYQVEIDSLVDLDEDSINKKIKSLKQKIDKFSISLEQLDETIIDLNQTQDEIIDKIEVEDITKLYEIKGKIKHYTDKAKELKAEVNPYLEPLKELNDLKLEPIDMDAINDLNKLITHQNYLIKLLTKKDSFIRKALLTKNLDFLNQRLKYYLSALGLPHSVEFSHDMTANISQFGRGLDFGNLSSGQKARVNLGLSFSFRDVLQKSHDSINVCMLDEVLDVGLDSVGVQNAARMLKRKAADEDLSLFIISHRDEVSNIFDNRMTVQMSKGFSSVVVEQ